MKAITTHVLDTARGKPASNVPVLLERQTESGFVEIAKSKTDADGRSKDLMKEGDLITGTYRLTFDTATYFADQKTKSFFPSASIVFTIEDENAHYHVPLLLAPYGYSTYRGS